MAHPPYIERDFEFDTDLEPGFIPCDVPYGEGTHDYYVPEPGCTETEHLPLGEDVGLVAPLRDYVTKVLLVSRTSGAVMRGLNENLRSDERSLLNGRIRLQLQLYQPLGEHFRTPDPEGRPVRVNLRIVKEKSPQAATFGPVDRTHHLQESYKYVGEVKVYPRISSFFNLPAVNYIDVTKFKIIGARLGYQYLVAGTITIQALRPPIEIQPFVVWYDPTAKSPKGYCMRRRRGIQEE